MPQNIAINAHSSIRVVFDVAAEGDAGIRAVVAYFDPFKIPAEAHDADVVFVTHDHYDHLSPEDIQKVAQPRTVFVAPASSVAALRKNGVDPANIFALEPGQTAEVLGLSVEAVHAYNQLKTFHPRKNHWLGYIVADRGPQPQRVYVAGDTDATPEAKAVECDIALVPVGGTYTMDAAAAAGLVNTIRPKVAIPTHYGCIVGKPGDGNAFKALVREDIEVQILL